MKFQSGINLSEADHKRLATQFHKVKELMLDEKWRTLLEISSKIGAPGPSVSAHLRTLRKKRGGNFVVAVRSRGNKDLGLFEYQVLPPGTVSEWDGASHKIRRNKLREALLAVWQHPDTTRELKDLIREKLK